jgi:hypothetical protein
MKKVTVTQLRVTIVTKEDEAGLSLSKLVSKLEAGSPTRQRRVLIGTQRCWVEFPGRASIRASTTLNVAEYPFSVAGVGSMDKQ